MTMMMMDHGEDDYGSVMIVGLLLGFSFSFVPLC